ncbi:MAG: hypothetical protein LC754_13130 [Acidobacteria bacterium]|nr:hypothetical protein [Acidobacteriota bacterium]
MTQTLDVSMESPQSGWMSLRLRVGAQSFVAVMSHAPHDSLAELMQGLTALLSGETTVTVKWNAEPEEYDFIFSARGERVELRVVHFPGHRTAGLTSHSPQPRLLLQTRTFPETLVLYDDDSERGTVLVK